MSETVSNVRKNAKSSSLYNAVCLIVSGFRGHRRGAGHDPLCHALIVIVMLMEVKETGKLASQHKF